VYADIVEFSTYFSQLLVHKIVLRNFQHGYKGQVDDNIGIFDLLIRQLCMFSCNGVNAPIEYFHVVVLFETFTHTLTTY